MQGLTIFLHAIRMVSGNFAAVLRLGGVALAVLVLLYLSMGGAALTPEPTMGRLTSAPTILLGLAQVVVGLWVAVAWHRYILLEEHPGALLPRWNGAAIWEYFKAGFVLALILLVVLVPLGIVAGLLLYPLMGATSASPPLLVGLIGFLVTFLPAIYIFYRLSPILPAAAIGHRLTLREAWYKTGTSGAAFVVLTLASVLASWALDLPTTVLAQASVTLALVWSALVQWLSLMVGASIMTTIYGHYVEGRPLNA